jgi:CRP/FNR family transcriptional regulator
VINPRLLERIDLFRDVRPRVREAIAARAVLRRYAAGQHLWRAGEAPRGLFVVLDGEVRIVSHARGRRHVVHVEGRGATLGDVPLFDGGAYPATAVAAEPTQCLVIDKGALRGVMATEPDLAWLLLARLAARVRHLVARLARQTSDPVRARLATYLLSRPASEVGNITLGGTQEAVAEELGTVREVVVRHLREFIADGCLQRTRRREYRILDAQALAAIASGPPR